MHDSNASNVIEVDFHGYAGAGGEGLSAAELVTERDAVTPHLRVVNGHDTAPRLADLSIWVAWRYQDGRKVPINPRTGRNAASDDPNTWGCRAAAEQCARERNIAGVGIVLTALGNGLRLGGIDLDTCRDVDGEVAPWALPVIERFRSYTEVSPSETGYKVFFAMRDEDYTAGIALLRAGEPDSKKTGSKWVVDGATGEHPPQVELYLSNRYFTVTGAKLDWDDIRIVSVDDVRWLINDHGPALLPAADSRARPRDTSRSGVAYRKWLAARRSGRLKSYDEMCDMLRADPETAVWVREKGERDGERELKRIFAKAQNIVTGAPYQIDKGAPLATARLFRELRYDVEDLSTLYRYRNGFYAWTGAAYPEGEDEVIRSQVYRFLDECVFPVKKPKSDEFVLEPVKPNTNLVNNVLDALRSETLLPGSVEAPAWLDGRPEPAAADIIACANGLLHLPSGELLPHDPTFFTHNALDFAYDPNAAAPVEWLGFLDQLWPEDQESIDTLQDTFGYCLGDDNSQQKAFMMVGPKRSGKGTIARVKTALIGKENTVSPTLASLSTNFGLEPLIDKRLAIISDARLSGRSDPAVIAERLLTITGDDGITVDRKYRKSWTGRLGARFWVLTNELPRLKDTSGALASRFIVLMLTESFYGREDVDLTNRLLRELPGILNWAIEGWRRLRDRKHFVQPTSAVELVRALEDLGSAVGTFLRDRCVVEPGRTVTVDELFIEWKDWCVEQGREFKGDKGSFGRDLRAAAPTVRSAQPRTQEGRVRVYEGVGLKPKEREPDPRDFRGPGYDY